MIIVIADVVIVVDDGIGENDDIVIVRITMRMR